MPPPIPLATYRLQLTARFGFDEAAAVVPYLKRLGITHLYASPFMKARHGSTHGYDIVDHGAINPELGGEAGFVQLSETLHAHGIKLLLDIVPNHMGVGGSDNPWWLSVLEWGSLSPFADAFDIDWQRLGAGRNLVIPFLGDRYGEALEKGVVRISFSSPLAENVELEGRLTRGTTVVDWLRQAGGPDNARILMAYDEKRFQTLIRAALAAR